MNHGARTLSVNDLLGSHQADYFAHTNFSGHVVFQSAKSDIKHHNVHSFIHSTSQPKNKKGHKTKVKLGHLELDEKFMFLLSRWLLSYFECEESQMVVLFHSFDTMCVL